MNRRLISDEKGAHIDEVEKKILLDNEYYGVGAVVDFREVLVDDGARHANSIHSWQRVILNSGAAVGGSIYSEEEIILRSGIGSKSGCPTVTIGDVLARQSLAVESQRKSAHETPVVIMGNTYAKNLEINGPAYFQGNVYATDSISVNAPTLIAGRLKVGREPFEDPRGRRFMVDGSADLKKTTAFGIICNGSLKIKDGVSVLEPIISIRNGEISMRKRDPIRVISAKCINCLEHEGNPFLCGRFLSGQCNRYDRLISADAIRVGERTVVSWYHRASLPMLGQHYMIHALYERALSRPSQSEFRHDGLGGHSFEDMHESMVRNLLEIDVSRDATARWFAKKLTLAANYPGNRYYEVLQRWLPGEPTPEELELKTVEPLELEADEVMTTFLPSSDRLTEPDAAPKDRDSIPDSDSDLEALDDLQDR